LASAHLALAFTWASHVRLNSDHLPVTISLPFDGTPPPQAAKTYTDFRKADWAAFVRESEGAFSSLQKPTSCGASEKVFRGVLLAAAKHSIPAGYNKEWVPGLSCEVTSLISERNALRVSNPTDPAVEALNHNITELIAENKKSLWGEKVGAAGSRPDASKYWSFLCGLSGKKVSVPPNQPISFGSKSIYNPRIISQKFIRQYVPYPKSDALTRKVQLKLHADHPLDHTFTPFTPALTEDALRKSSSSMATGPDGLTSLHLAGPVGISYLTDVFNLSVKDAVIPAIWKSARVLPILKPGKPANQGTSYRPISFLCPAIKVLERLLLPSLTSSLQASPSQHGFCPDRSIITALLPLVVQILEGFNSNKPAVKTAVVALDLSKVFDTVNLTLQKSKFVIVHIKVPQGSVLSSCLFNFFTSDFPEVNGLKVSFADDFNFAASDPVMAVIKKSLKEELVKISKWAKNKRLKISAEKSEVTYFTPWNGEKDTPKIFYEGVQIPVEKTLKFLGTLFDGRHTFSQNLKASASKERGRVPIVKAVIQYGGQLACLQVIDCAGPRSKCPYLVTSKIQA
jgi:hypothetical protein